MIAPHFHVRAWVVFLMHVIALVAGITHMYVGVSYRQDVLAETILGSALGLLVVLVDGSAMNGILKSGSG